jgi:hypothetical protein
LQCISPIPQTLPPPGRHHPLARPQKTGISLEELYHQKPAAAVAADYAAWMETYGEAAAASAAAAAAAGGGKRGGARGARGSGGMEAATESGPERRAENSYIAFCIKTGAWLRGGGGGRQSQTRGDGAPPRQARRLASHTPCPPFHH